MLTPRSSTRFFPLLHRSYASTTTTTTTNSDRSHWPSHAFPTPYEILSTSPKDPYSKHRYVELVKLYHPDRPTSSSSSSLPTEIRLERFRLVVAANAILACPTKRQAYDRYGAGWNGAPSAPSTGWWNNVDIHHHHHHHHHHHREGGHEWSTSGEPPRYAYAYGKGGPDDPSRCASWEDWQRFYERNGARPAEGNRQQEMFVSNGAFVGMILVLAGIGGMVEITYVANEGGKLVENGERKSGLVSNELRRIKTEVREAEDKDARIKKFLRSRDPARRLDSRELLPGATNAQGPDHGHGGGLD